MTSARALLIAPGSSGAYHCVQRCVRRAFLCGKDRYTGQSFEHREDWVDQRLQLLAVCIRWWTSDDPGVGDWIAVVDGGDRGRPTASLRCGGTRPGNPQRGW